MSQSTSTYQRPSGSSLPLPNVINSEPRHQLTTGDPVKSQRPPRRFHSGGDVIIKMSTGAMLLCVCQ